MHLLFEHCSFVLRISEMLQNNLLKDLYIDFIIETISIPFDIFTPHLVDLQHGYFAN